MPIMLSQIAVDECSPGASQAFFDKLFGFIKRSISFTKVVLVVAIEVILSDESGRL